MRRPGEGLQGEGVSEGRKDVVRDDREGKCGVVCVWKEGCERG